jgi:RimJ/RimL family protein N-acetyltransferase
MTFPSQIETERLLLRWPNEADAKEIFSRYACDPAVSRYMSWTTHRTADESLDFVRQSIEQRKAGSVFVWLIYPHTGGPLLGSIGFSIKNHLVQIGYCFARDAWGNGYATEASQAIVAMVLEEPSVWRVQAYCEVTHSASARVLEKAGLRLEGTLRRYSVLPNVSEVPQDVLIYACVREN